MSAEARVGQVSPKILPLRETCQSGEEAAFLPWLCGCPGDRARQLRWLYIHRRMYSPAILERCPKPTMKHPTKVHVWGGILDRGATRVLVFKGRIDVRFFSIPYWQTAKLRKVTQRYVIERRLKKQRKRAYGKVADHQDIVHQLYIDNDELSAVDVQRILRDDHWHSGISGNRYAMSAEAWVGQVSPKILPLHETCQSGEEAAFLPWIGGCPGERAWQLDDCIFTNKSTVQLFWSGAPNTPWNTPQRCTCGVGFWTEERQGYLCSKDEWTRDFKPIPNSSVTVAEHETAKSISSIGIHLCESFTQKSSPMQI